MALGARELALRWGRRFTPEFECSPGAGPAGSALVDGVGGFWASAPHGSGTVWGNVRVPAALAISSPAEAMGREQQGTYDFSG